MAKKRPDFLNRPARDSLGRVSAAITGYDKTEPKLLFNDSFPGGEYREGLLLNPKRMHVLQLRRIPKVNGESDEMYEGNKTMELMNLKGKLAKRGIKCIPGTLHNQCLEIWFGRDLPRRGLLGPSVERRVYDVVFLAYSIKTNRKGELVAVGNKDFGKREKHV